MNAHDSLAYFTTGKPYVVELLVSIFSNMYVRYYLVETEKRKVGKNTITKIERKFQFFSKHRCL